MVAYYLSILRRRAWLVVAVAAVFAPAMFLTLTSGPATYSSVAVIEVDRGSATDGIIDDGRSFAEPERRIATELEVLTGRAVAENAAERLRAQGWTTDSTALLESVEASARGGASALEVVGTDTDPVRAQQLTSAVVSAYLDNRRDAGRAELERVQADLQQRLSAAAAADDSQVRYDTLAEWLEGVSLRLSVDTSGLQLISPPSLPDEAQRPVSPLVAGVASALGALLLGCGLALAVDLIRDSVRTREEAELLLPAPTLVEIPRLRADRTRWTAALTDPADPTSAAARGLRLRLGGTVASGTPSRVMVAGVERDAPDVLAVASALAATYGRSHLRVLLVGDHADGTGFRGLVATGADRSTVTAEGAPDARATVLPGVWTAPATTGPDGTDGLLDGHDPATALDAWSRAFDVIVLAIPPAADEAEAVAISHLAQAVVVVCALGRTPAKRLRRLVSSLERSGSIVNGLALTTRARSGRHRNAGPTERPSRVPVGAA